MSKGRETEKVKRVDAAFAALRRAILDRALEPGSRLPAESIGAGFAMSRTLAREVLLRLEGIGLVEIRPKRGAIVACPSISEARDVFEVRRSLEAQSVASVCDQWMPELEQELDGHVRQEESAIKDGNLGNSIHLAETFHITLARMSGNRVLAQYVDEVVSRCSLILALYGRPHSTECSVSEHRMIVEALKARDKGSALGIMDDHLATLQDRAAEENNPPEKPGLEQVISQYAKREEQSR
jgi:DNA-binding GntR family transcriptional regulator